jgi:TatA/E family protein of Tat protein translocase
LILPLAGLPKWATRAEGLARQLPFAVPPHLMAASIRRKLMLAMIGSPGQILLLSLVVLLLFGHKLPSTMRSLGQSMRAFREGLQESETARLEE